MRRIGILALAMTLAAGAPAARSASMAAPAASCRAFCSGLIPLVGLNVKLASAGMPCVTRTFWAACPTLSLDAVTVYSPDCRPT